MNMDTDKIIKDLGIVNFAVNGMLTTEDDVEKQAYAAIYDKRMSAVMAALAQNEDLTAPAEPLDMPCNDMPSDDTEQTSE